MFLIVAIFLAVTVVWLTYWSLVRPVVLDSVEHELATMRSQVDWAIIEGLPASHSRAAQRLTESMARGRRFISVFSILYLAYLRRTQVKAEVAKDREIFDEAPKWICELRARNGELTAKAALANSPLWWPLIAVMLLIAMMSAQAAAWLKETEEAAVIVNEKDCPA